MKEELVGLLGAAAVATRPVHDLWPLGVMRRRAGLRDPALLVVKPGSYEEVAKVLAWAAQRGLRVLAAGGGSGVCGALAGAQGELAIDLGRLDRIMEVDEVNLLCRVQAGVRGLALETHLNQRGLTLGHYPTSLEMATVGGLISTRSSGQQSTRYGSVEDMVQGLRVALLDGTLLEPRPGPRSAVGPALEQLWMGAEGQLGVVLEAVLRLHRLPERVLGRGYLFPALETGLDAMREVMQAGLRPLVLRLYDADDTAFQGVAEPGCLLVVAVAGPAAVALAEAELVAGACRQARDLGPEPWDRWQRHRFDLGPERLLGMLESPGSFLDTIEVAAAWDRLPGLHARIKQALAVGGVALCHFSHAYPWGCCGYFTFAGGVASEEEAEALYLRAWEGAMAACLEVGATISHHHGVGQARARWAPLELGGWSGVWERVRRALTSS